jgi:hypothetical protein
MSLNSYLQKMKKIIINYKPISKYFLIAKIILQISDRKMKIYTYFVMIHNDRNEDLHILCDDRH